MDFDKKNFKIETFRATFDVDEVSKITANKSKFYNDAVIEKINTIDLLYPQILKELRFKRDIKTESYEFKTAEVKRLKKRLQVLENQIKEDEKELNKLDNDIDKYSKILKEKEDVKENQSERIAESKSEIDEYCKKIIEHILRNKDNSTEIIEVPNYLKDKLDKNIFTDWNNFKEVYFKNYIDNLDSDFLFERFSKSGNRFEDKINEDEIQFLKELVDSSPI